MNNNPNWFKNWFNSPYYHILYKNRNEKEAEFFLENLLNYLALNKNDLICDLACGKGRHAVFLNKKGFQVLGLDIAPDSICEAKKNENNSLSFAVHDMRQTLGSNRFNAILNLFTSFGYFDSLKENNKVLNNIYNALKPGGTLVIDFFNATKVQNQLIPFEQKVIDGITFNIAKKVENGKIYKKIAFNHHHKDYQFCEEVQLISKKDFVIMLQNNNFVLDMVFGDYELNEFNETQSDRLILIARKK